ncbi:hypothetical protein N7U66_12585 [Lacinutrix neustonica]|uniref:Uncharacterized protein n=1 Tax=Lacinutrix neustonica TaxID=2980107 RepID=A0A9E8MT61_9FLAO|nr:hypothetical protein [Lacinutrix neustonica]WAC01012.1 hypothetical protein N7U66_12585 [Lacinutrix neustonica]
MKTIQADFPNQKKIMQSKKISFLKYSIIELNDSNLKEINGGTLGGSTGATHSTRPKSIAH